jgi:hypothetical protein
MMVGKILKQNGKSFRILIDLINFRRDYNFIRVTFQRIENSLKTIFADYFIKRLNWRGIPDVSYVYF